MISGIIAKYAKVVRKSDEHIVALAVDYFHEDAIRCTYLISIEKGKIAPNIGLCAEKTVTERLMDVVIAKLWNTYWVKWIKSLGNVIIGWIQLIYPKKNLYNWFDNLALQSAY